MISKIAVGTDGSATAAEAVKFAVGMAQRFDAELVLISAFPGPGLAKDGGGGSADEMQWASSPAARTREILARAEDEVRGEGIKCSSSLTRAIRHVARAPHRLSARRMSCDRQQGE